MRRLLPLLFSLTTVLGCGSRTPASAKIPLGQAAQGENLTGSVQEQLAAPPYVYLHLKTSTGDVWAAVPEAKVENGASVTVFGPMLMTNFESRTLKRTFPEVWFGTLEAPEAAAAGAAENPHAGAQQPAAAVDVGTVAKASGADARSVVEVWDQRTSLDGKPVSIRGKVVKHNDEVMGKNWIHLQDGTGDAARGTHDITVTSLDRATTGEIITITGTVRTNRDFGAGYTYPVIVEDAKVRRP